MRSCGLELGFLELAHLVDVGVQVAVEGFFRGESVMAERTAPAGEIVGVHWAERVWREKGRVGVMEVWWVGESGWWGGAVGCRPGNS